MRRLLRRKKKGKQQPTTTLRLCFDNGDFSKATQSLLRGAPRPPRRRLRGRAVPAVLFVHVEDSGMDSHVQFEEGEALEFFTHLARVAPQMTHLHLEDVTITSAVLAWLILKHPKLTTLKLEGVHFQAGSQRIGDIAANNSSCLDTIILQSCEFTGCSLDEILCTSLAPCRHQLTNLVVKDTPLSESLLVSLCHHTANQSLTNHLTSLEISDMGTASNLDQHIISMAQALDTTTTQSPTSCTTTSLQRIKLFGNFWTSESCHTWASMLERNTTLRHVSLGGMDWKDFGEPMGRCLQQNTTLQTLEIINVTFYDDSLHQQITTMAHALARSNRSLQELHLSWPNVGPGEVRRACIQPMTEMLHANPVLCDLSLGGPGTLTSMEIQFYLKLNRQGLRQAVGYQHKKDTTSSNGQGDSESNPLASSQLGGGGIDPWVHRLFQIHRQR